MTASVAPRVSVLLPVFNGGVYLRESLESVLRQTFGAFEVIAVDDGSTDGSGELLDSISDERLRVVHQRNAGLPVSLNRAINLARGEFLARQDADDVCMPDRFKRQVAFLEEDLRCAVVGTWSEILEEDRKTDRGHRHPCENGELQMRMVFDSFFVHGSVMMRRAALDVVGGYPEDPGRFPPEDFDLWSRIARRFRVANLPEVLELYRELPVSISRTKAALLQQRAVGIAVENLQYILGQKYDGVVLGDLAAAVRGAKELISAAPNWNSMAQAIVDLQQHFLRRFPAEAKAIERGERALDDALQRARARQTLGSGVMQRVRARLLRFRH